MNLNSPNADPINRLLVVKALISFADKTGLSEDQIKKIILSKIISIFNILMDIKIFTMAILLGIVITTGMIWLAYELFSAPNVEDDDEDRL